MKSIKLKFIEELAQEFLQAPRISRTNNGLSIVYDYEMDSGEYGEKSIFFEDVRDYRHIHEDDVKAEMIEAAYNSIVKIVDSDWLSNGMSKQGYNHFLIYFDDYGVFEVIAKSFNPE